MGFAIELAIDMNKHSDIVIRNKERRKLAEEYECEMQYFMHEIEGKKRRTQKNDSIQVVIFDNENFNNLLEFIKKIRIDKKNYIECIYRDETSCDLLYASPSYLRKLDKNVSKAFKAKRKNTDLNDEELAIWEAIKFNR
jgi:S-adenosylmethionine:diacylglycerol 3-amino-3-carboxypropyl transferase